jgi:hypothetical protein
MSSDTISIYYNKCKIFDHYSKQPFTNFQSSITKSRIKVLFILFAMGYYLVVHFNRNMTVRDVTVIVKNKHFSYSIKMRTSLNAVYRAYLRYSLVL